MFNARLTILVLVLFLMLFSVDLLNAQNNAILMETNWQTCDYGPEVSIESQSTQGMIKGRYPQGWSDNSSWAPVVYNSQIGQEGTDRFWHLQAPIPLKARIQLQHQLPVMGGGDYYELILDARGNQAIELGVRQIGDPYQFLWKVSKMLSPEWKTYRWQFKVRKTLPDEVGFWLNLEGTPASVDFKHIVLRQINIKELDAQNRKRFPGSGPCNLLRQTRLPLGLPSGWALDRMLDDQVDVNITSVTDSTSPTGQDVLSISSPDKPMKLFGEPMQVNRIWLPHTASVYVKGQGKLRVSVNNAKRRLAYQDIELSTAVGWKRLAMTFKPVMSEQVTYMLFEGQGQFYIDGLMVHSGEQVNAYQSQLPVEVALTADAGEIAGYTRTHFEDETPRVCYVVTGVEPNAHAKLRVKIINVYGHEKPLPAILLSHANVLQGSIAYNVFPKQPYGSFRIEAWVENEQGKVISTFNELVMHRLRRPHYWMKDAPRSAFGVHTLSIRRHIQMAKAVGINWTRLHDAGTEYIGWYHLEPSPGKWDFRDTELNRYRQFGMKIFGVLSTAPKWASVYPGYDVRNYFDRYYMPKDNQQFSEYVKVVVKRYEKIIDAWDVWNEPWGTWWSSGYDRSKTGRAGYLQGPNETKTFAEFQKVVYQTVKAVKSDAIVAGFNTHVSGTGADWTRGIIEHGATPYADVFSYHQYTLSNAGYPDDVIQAGLKQHADLFPAKKFPYPAWMTEGSSVSGLIDSGFYHHTLPNEPEENVIHTADQLGRYCLSLLTNGVEKFFLYSMHCHQYFGLGNEHHALVTSEGYLHPSADAISAMAYFLEDKIYQDHQEPAKDVHAYRFTGQGQTVTVLCAEPSKSVRYVLPQITGVRYWDLFGNPMTAGSPLSNTMVFAVSQNVE